jgi:RNA polymerase sigma-70 factor (ECF subfamily)
MDIQALYAKHGEWLRDWLRRHTRCRERAADLSQDTFRRLLEQPAPSSVASPRGYLATVARRLLIDDIRRQTVERSVLHAWCILQGDREDITPARIAEAVQLLDVVMRALEAMPDLIRRAFLLKRVEGLCQEAVAERLGISLSSARRYIAQAYAQCLTASYVD